MKFYLSILLCLVCLSCANQADQYIIRGSFPGLQDGMTVRLLNAETRNKDEQLLAADTVKNGRFELTGSVDAPVMCHLWISNKDIVSNKKQSRSLGTRLFLDHSAIKIRTPHFDSLYYISEYGPDDRELLTEVVGGTLQKDYMDYRQTVHANELEYSKYNSILSTLNWDRMATPDKYTPEEYHRLYTESYRLRKEAAERLHADRMAFIRSHRQSPLALYVANEMISKSFSVPATDLEEILARNCRISDTARAARFCRQAEQACYFCKDIHYPDVPLHTPTFDTTLLSAHIRPGHVTLIDCWASWCGPCRAAIPKVKALYDKYGRDRFDVISISLDSKKEDWQKALEEEKMPWPQFIAGKRGYKQLTSRYNISSIPNLILIDGKGQVVCNTFSPEEIRIELEQILR